MLDFSSLYNNTDNPGLMMSLFTVLFSLVLSSIIAFTYDKTSRDVNRPDQFIQALILIAIVSATVMQAIGDSLARGLGMLGALAIIRFRTTLTNPRNMVFMFAAIASGISCGVFGFTIAITGTLIFCAAAFFLRLSPFSHATNLNGSVRVILPPDTAHTHEDIQAILKPHCSSFYLMKYRFFTDLEKQEKIEYEYEVKLKKEEEGLKLVADLKTLVNVEDIKISVRDREEKI